MDVNGAIESLLNYHSYSAKYRSLIENEDMNVQDKVDAVDSSVLNDYYFAVNGAECFVT